MKIINCTPHEIVLNSGEVFPPSGQVATTIIEMVCTETVGGWFGDPIRLFKKKYGSIVGIPNSPDDLTLFIVSDDVFAANNSYFSGGSIEWRNDLITPATGHPEAKRNEKGQIISVPGFVI